MASGLSHREMGRWKRLVGCRRIPVVPWGCPTRDRRRVNGGGQRLSSSGEGGYFVTSTFASASTYLSIPAWSSVPLPSLKSA